jgi:signal transduction histidine kinase
MAILFDLDTQRRHPLGDRISIGRGETNDIRLDDPMVARNHAEILRGVDGTYSVRDLGSRHGTFIGANKVAEYALRDGDELLVGPVRLRFETASSTGSASSPQSDAEELRRLRAVVELSRAIGVEHDLDRLLERVLATCFQTLRADRAMIMVYAPKSKTPCASAARTRDGTTIPNALSTSVLSQVLATHEPYLRTEIASDLALQRSESLSAHRVRSLIAVPLLYEASESEWIGVIQLDSQAMNHVFSPTDLELLQAIASQAALAIKNAMLVRQAQASQTEHWRRLERVVKTLQVGIIVVDDEQRCVLVNEWIAQRAATLGSAIQGSIIDHIAGVPCERLIGGDVREQVTVGVPETTFVISAHSAADGRETVMIVSDITQERSNQAKAAHQDRLALIGQLAGGIAHDFNNLLFVISNYAGLLRESISDPQAIEDITMIGQASSSATDLVRQLLAFSRRETVKPKVIDPVRVVASMEMLLRRSLGTQHELQIETTGPSRNVLMDPSQLEQIVMNLVVNARDAMADAGRVLVRVGAAAERFVLEVVDNGCGMTREVAAHIFDPYFTTKELGKGTGLGLATVHGIVQHAGGEIVVDSEVGSGTVFRIFLPTTDISPTEEPSPFVPVDQRGRILLVDDDEHVRRVTERMLRRSGYEVCTASSGPEALAAVRQASFDFLLTDMVMPGMTGRELARVVSREYPNVRVLFMSGYNPGTPVPSWQFLGKPFERMALLEKLAQLRGYDPKQARVGDE